MLLSYLKHICNPCEFLLFFVYCFWQATPFSFEIMILFSYADVFASASLSSMTGMPMDLALAAMCRTPGNAPRTRVCFPNMLSLIPLASQHESALCKKLDLLKNGVVTDNKPWISRSLLYLHKLFSCSLIPVQARWQN